MPLRFFMRTNSQVQPQTAFGDARTAKELALEGGAPTAKAHFNQVQERHGSAPCVPIRENSETTLHSQSTLDVFSSDVPQTSANQVHLSAWNCKWIGAGASVKGNKFNKASLTPSRPASIDEIHAARQLGSKSLSGVSNKTFAELAPIEEGNTPNASRPASPEPTNLANVSKANALQDILTAVQYEATSDLTNRIPEPPAVERRDSDITAVASLSSHSLSVESLVASVASLSVAGPAEKEKKPRGILARFLKKDSKDKKDEKQQAAVTAKDAKDIQRHAEPKDAKSATSKPKPKEKEKLTPEQKEAKALAERERRLEEVLSVLEGRKKLPQGMEDLKFANFIGDGTYGFVVTAFRGDEEVAVKFIFKDKIPVTAWMNDDDLGTIPSEIYFLKNLRHPNLIRFLGCYEDEKYMIMVTELHGTSWDSANPKLQGRYIEGLRATPRAQRVGSEGKGDLNTLSSLSAAQRQMLRPRVSCDLFECIDAHEYFPERVVRHIFRQVASVVAYLHSQGVVHRDLKDENIVIDENYNVKLIDFGSAAFIPPSSGPLFDKFLGTMDFAAPEIIEGFRYRGPEVEIWALGVLLYILVFRQVPFKNSQDIVSRSLHLPVELRDYYAGTEELYDLVNWMLQENKDKRPKIQDVLNHKWVRMGLRPARS